MSMAINFGRMGIYNEKFPSLVLPDSLYHAVLQGFANNFSCSITITTRSMAIKLGKVVTYYQKLQPIKIHNPLNTWAREVT